jgi:hypothetical protein
VELVECPRGHLPDVIVLDVLPHPLNRLSIVRGSLAERV